MIYMHMLFFFFQAEDGIRDVAVTGVQTCALPIYLEQNFSLLIWLLVSVALFKAVTLFAARYFTQLLSIRVTRDLRQQYFRSEERRVGKECRYRWSMYD